MMAGLGAERVTRKSGIITRWTPGARRDTPGFIGLGTLQGPHYSVQICPPNGYTKFTDKHTSCCTGHWNLNQKTSPNSLMSLWQRDNKHSWHMGCRTFTLRWSLPVFLPLSLSIAQWKQKSARLSLLTRHRNNKDVMYGKNVCDF